MAGDQDFASERFDEAVRTAGRRAFEETLAAGLPVFYLDSDGMNVMEGADGRRFEIRWFAGVTSAQNYEIIRELKGARRLATRSRPHADRGPERVREVHTHALGGF